MLKRKGQAATEYLIIFIALALITLLSLSTFYPKVKSIGQDLFRKAAERIVE